ncbi:MAG: DNA repair protein RadA [Deltaproteobacteria bacterium]|nr:DNA repair protein RadA [Deltaproteobacteria bacterium]
MKAKRKTIFECEACGYQTPKWMGKCGGCDAWNSLVEHASSLQNSKHERLVANDNAAPVLLDEISLEKTPRYPTHIEELDRVLGGGAVPGSLILLGGDPGIGKSTLIIQTLNNLALNNHSCFYVTGEESKEQIKMRAERLQIKANFPIYAENALDQILLQAEKAKPELMVVDSIQTVFIPNMDSAPGSISQIRECTLKLLQFAKTTQTTIILIGHVTKEGALAGPRVLEHMVDCVLSFEGEKSGQFRLLRTIKNRFGSTNEIGVFEMTGAGLEEVSNPSAHFLKERQTSSIGSCVTASLEGTRPILTEIQSLVSSSMLNNPRRTAIGLDHNRVALLVAVLEKVAGLNLYAQDIYVNAVGGLKLHEPSSDLAILLSMVSSFKNQALAGHLMAVGEIGLNGEVRSIPFVDKRIFEAKKLGYTQIIVPGSAKLPDLPKDIEVLKIKSIQEALDLCF